MNVVNKEIYRKLVLKEALLQIKKIGKDPKFKISSGQQASLLAQNISNLLIGVLEAPDSNSGEKPLDWLQNIEGVNLNINTDMMGLVASVASKVQAGLKSDS